MAYFLVKLEPNKAPVNLMIFFKQQVYRTLLSDCFLISVEQNWLFSGISDGLHVVRTHCPEKKSYPN